MVVLLGHKISSSGGDKFYGQKDPVFQMGWLRELQGLIRTFSPLFNEEVTQRATVQACLAGEARIWWQTQDFTTWEAFMAAFEARWGLTREELVHQYEGLRYRQPATVLDFGSKFQAFQKALGYDKDSRRALDDLYTAIGK